MGLFHRPTVATPSSGHSFVDVIQNEGNNTSRGLIAWRHPSTDFNTHSKLIVRKGEEAIFEDGASEWAIFPEGTECELHTQNIAVIRKFREFLSGGHSYFPCRVYFISTEDYEIPWGTVEPVGYTCPLLGEGAQLRGGGQYIIRVVDSETFVKKVLRDGESYTVQDLKEKLFERVYQEIAETISTVLENNAINSMECSKKKREIATLCQPEIQKLLDSYGLLLVGFTINLQLDEEQRQMYEQAVRLQRMNAQGEDQARIISARSKVKELETMGNAYTTIKGMELLETLAENPAGGIASAGAGIGMGMAAGSVVSNIAETVFSNSRIVQPQQPQQQNFGGTGRFGNAGGSPCGTSQPSSEPDPIASLEKMKMMLEKGLIPQAIYDQKVAEILSRL